MLPIQLLVSLPLTLLVAIVLSAGLVHLLPPEILIPTTMVTCLGAFLGLMAISKRMLELAFYPRMERMAQEIDGKHEFNMGLFGLLFRIGVSCVMAYAVVNINASASIKYYLRALASVFGILTVRNIALEHSLSPWYKGAMLSVSPDGISAREWFIPWSDVIDVVGSSNRDWSVYINTTRPRYVYGSMKNRIYGEPNQVPIKATGALPEALAAYLNSRAKLQNRRKVAGAS